MTDAFMREPNQRRLMELGPIVIGSLIVFSASVDEIIHLLESVPVWDQLESKLTRSGAPRTPKAALELHFIHVL